MLPCASQAGPSMPLVNEFSAVSGRATNSDSSAARADSSTHVPGQSKAARVINDFQWRFKILIGFKCLCSAEWLIEVQPGKQEVWLSILWPRCYSQCREDNSVRPSERNR